MQIGARKPQHLQLVRRPPSTPDDMDEANADVFRAIGWVAAIVLAIVFLGAIVTFVFSLVPR